MLCFVRINRNAQHQEVKGWESKVKMWKEEENCNTISKINRELNFEENNHGGHPSKLSAHDIQSITPEAIYSSCWSTWLQFISSVCPQTYVTSYLCSPWLELAQTILKWIYNKKEVTQVSLSSASKNSCPPCAPCSAQTVQK